MLPIQRPSSVSRRRSLLLVLLCAVQGCERFAFLAMLPLFVLYAQDRHAMPAPIALLVLAVFQALSYLGTLPAGWLADRKLGARVATLLGAALLACGYGGLALERAALLWPALGLMVVGHNLFKPGLHVLIGSIGAGDDRAQERAFLWHYLAANLGYAAGALFGEWAHARHGWAAIFGGAAAASAASAGLLAVGLRSLRGDVASASAVPACASSGSRSTSMRAVWLLSGVAVVFWLTAQQAGSSLTVFAAMNTVQQVTVFGRALQIGPGHFAALHGLIVLAMLPAFLLLHGRKRLMVVSTVGMMLWGYVATAAAFALMAAAGLRGGDLGRVGCGWLVGCYFLLSLAEVLLAPLGVSLLTRLAPKDKTARAIGLWFAGCAFGNGLAGVLGLWWNRWPHHSYFALLSVVSLGAAAILLSRRRQIDWFADLSASPASSAMFDERMDAIASPPDICPGNPSTSNPAPSRVVLALATLAIVLPGVMATMRSLPLPLPVRGVSAIMNGLAVLLCGPYLVGQVLDHLPRSSAARLRS